MNRMLRDFQLYLQLFGKYGLWGVIACKRLPSFLSSLFPSLRLTSKVISIESPDCQYPIFLRYQSSDAKVFIQIFVEQEYLCLKDIRDPKLIIDCGANVGFSSIYFLNHFPNSHIIAIEPDPDNFAICQKNLAPYGERVTLIQAGVWSKTVGLNLKTDYRDGRGWAVQVEECPEGQTPDIQAVDLTSLLQDAPYTEIDLLKVDIERSEAVLFAEHYEEWLSHTKNIAIELHDQECEAIFYRALTSCQYDVQTSGELTICMNIQNPNPILA